MKFKNVRQHNKIADVQVEKQVDKFGNITIKVSHEGKVLVQSHVNDNEATIAKVVEKLSKQISKD